MSTYYVLAGETVFGVTLSSYSHQNVSSGGTAIDTKIFYQGYQTVSSGGSAVDTTVSETGTQYVLSGGVALNTSQLAGGNVGVTVYGGDFQTKVAGTNVKGAFSLSSGIAENFILYNVGSQNVSSGGVARNTTVSGWGAYQNISSGGSAVGTILSAGFQSVLSGGVALKTSQHVGGRVNVTVRGSDSATKVTGTNASGTFSLSNGVARNFIVYVGGRQDIVDGGVASGTRVSGGSGSGTWQYVSSGGSAFGTTLSGCITSWHDDVENGTFSWHGMQIITFGGAAVDTMIYDVGLQEVSSGGVASGATIFGGVSGGSQVVFSNGVASCTTVSGGHQSVMGMAGNTVIVKGGQTVASGGSAVGTVISSAGFQIVSSGGVSLNVSQLEGGRVYVTVCGNDSSTRVTGINVSGVFNLSNGVASNFILYAGVQTVSSGGVAYNTTLSGGGQIVSSGGSALGTKIFSGCSQYVYSGVALNVSQFEGGLVNVAVRGGDSETRVTGINANGAFSLSNGVASNFILYAGCDQNVFSGGMAHNTTIGFGGKLEVSSGGAALNVNQLEGGQINVAVCGGDSVTRVTGTNANGAFSLSNGVASNFILYSGGRQYVSLGGVANGTTIFSGGHQYIYYSGVASGTVVSSGGCQHVSRNGGALHTILHSAGSQIVLSGGSALYTSVYLGAVQIFSSGAVGKGTNVSMGGAEIVSSGAKVSGTFLSGGGSQNVLNGGEADGTVIFSGGAQFVSSGGVARKTLVSGYYAHQDVCFGGVAIDTTIFDRYQYVGGMASNTTLSSGWQYVLSGGVADGTTVYSGASQRISSGGIASATRICNGGAAYVRPGGMAIGARVSGGGSLLVSSGGIASAARIYSGGEVHVRLGGSALGSVISSGGVQTIFSGGVASQTKILVSGLQVVSSGGVAQNTVLSGYYAHQDVRFGGVAVGTSVFDRYQYVGGVASNTVLSSGWQYVLSGGVANVTTVYSGASQRVSSGGIASAAKICAGGGQYVSSGARAVETRVLDGGNVYVYKGGRTTDLTVKAGGRAYLAGGALSGVNTVKGAVVTVKRAGVKISTIRADSSTLFNYDIRDVRAGAGVMLAETSSQALACKFRVTAGEGQAFGEYRLSSNLKLADNTAFSIRIGSENLGTSRLNGASCAKNGVEYVVGSNDSVVSLTCGLKAADLRKGTSANNRLIGSEHNEIFYGGAGDDKLYGVNGCDVAVYNTGKWGEDTIVATDGRMTLLFAGLASSDITTIKSGNDLLISRNSDSIQNIVVEGWNDATHSIVFTDTLARFTKYLKASSPTEAQTNAARNEVWQKAGLAASTSNA